MIKIWNRPKVEFSHTKAYAIEKEFHLWDSGKGFEIYNHHQYGEEYVELKENKTFEQAVNEWVENYVKQNFPPIVLPDEYETESSDEYDNGCVDGRNNCIKELLKLNPNIIIEEVQ